jgi:hypothetical protein
MTSETMERIFPPTPIRGDHAAPAKGAGVIGYLDASSGSRLFGWAWDPERPTARIAIRLVANGDAVAALIADRSRADLKANGIGDGAHAFEVELPAGLPREAVEIQAVCPDSGETIVLTAPPSAAAAAGDVRADRNEILARLVRSHQHLHHTVREALGAIAELRERPAEVLPEALNLRLETVEAAMLRIDALVAEQQTQLRLREEAGTDRMKRALCSIAFVFAVAALVTAFLVIG